MLIPRPGATPCLHHSRQLAKQQRRQQTTLAKELLADADNFTTADCVHTFLGNSVKQMAYKRINRSDAMAMAYISQLLLTSHRASPGNGSRLPTRLHRHTAEPLPQTRLPTCPKK